MKKLIFLILILIILGLWYYPNITKYLVITGAGVAKSITGYLINIS